MEYIKTSEWILVPMVATMALAAWAIITGYKISLIVDRPRYYILIVYLLAAFWSVLGWLVWRAMAAT